MSPHQPSEDVDWITGGGPSEASASSGPTDEQQALIRRRVLIGGAATAGLIAFSLVPTKDLRLKPSKPLYFYLAGLMRVQVRRAGLGWGSSARGDGKCCACQWVGRARTQSALLPWRPCRAAS